MSRSQPVGWQRSAGEALHLCKSLEFIGIEGCLVPTTRSLWIAYDKNRDRFVNVCRHMLCSGLLAFAASRRLADSAFPARGWERVRPTAFHWWHNHLGRKSLTCSSNPKAASSSSTGRGSPLPSRFLPLRSEPVPVSVSLFLASDGNYLV